MRATALSHFALTSALSLFITAAVPGCSGTRTRNPPSAPTQLVSVQLSGANSLSVSDLNLCVTSVTLQPTGGGTPVTIPISTSAVSVSADATTLAQATVPTGAYQSMTAQLNPQCAEKSLSFTNPNGSYVLNNSVTLSFVSDISISSSTQALVLNIQPFVDQLASVKTDGGAQSAIQTTTGTIATTASGGISLEVPIEMLDMGAQATGAAPYTFQRSLTTLNTGDYDGAVTYLFEVVAKNYDTTTHDVWLVDQNGTTIATIPVPPSANDSYLQTSFTPDPGANVYYVRLDGATAPLGLYSARIRVRQIGATMTKIYVPLLTGPDGDTTPDDQGAPAAPVQAAGSGLAYSNFLWLKNSAAFSQLDPSTPYTFEVVMQANLGATASALLWDSDQGNAVSGPPLSTTASVPTLLSSSFANDPSNDGDHFEVAVEPATLLYRAGLWIKLENLAHAEVYALVGGAGNYPESELGFGNSNYALLNASHFSAPITEYYETGGDVTNMPSCSSVLADVGTYSSIGSATSILPSEVYFTSSSTTYERSGPLSLTDGHVYESETIPGTGSGTCTFAGARMVIAF